MLHQRACKIEKIMIRAPQTAVTTTALCGGGTRVGTGTIELSVGGYSVAPHIITHRVVVPVRVNAM